jgi:hypothetical protein
MKKRERASGLNRREVLQRLAAGAGASAALPALGHAATHDAAARGHAQAEAPALGSEQPPDPTLSSKDWKPKFLDAHQNETVEVLSDHIIPDTDTPGARAAEVNRFIDLLLSASDADFQKQYIQALGWLDGYCLKKYTNPFVKLEHGQQTEILTLLTHKSDDPEIAHGAELFGVIKGSIVYSYYSSEIGSVQDLKYDTNPFHAEFPGCPNPDEHKSS